MASVVFFRAANVGGHQVFKPAALAKELADLDVVSIGAAGTLVVRTNASAKVITAALAAKLPFDPDVMIVPAAKMIALGATALFDRQPSDADRMVTVIAGRPVKAPTLPIERPASDWQVRILGVEGPFVLSVRRPRQPVVYPNPIVEKEFGVAGTTRKWTTIDTILAKLAN